MAMNWSEIDFDWNQVRAFLATVEEGSLSGAARALGTTQPTVGRQVSALEQGLGVSLFERAGRGLVLTPSGAAILEAVQEMGSAAARISVVAAGQNDSVAGRVAISVSDMMAIHIMPDILRKIRDKAPEIEIELIVTNDISDLLRREADIAIRHVEPTEPELIGRQIRSGVARFYASDAFIAKHGCPRRLAEAKDLPMIGFAAPQAMADELARRGLQISAGTIQFYSGAICAAWAMVEAGLGVGLMSEDMAEDRRGLRRILEDEPTLPVDMWLVTHRDVRTSRRIRLVWDILRTELAP
ncbi:LysR family transcriptional regulator [Gymnodinialimonas sp. 2305UL16-5]|uniref:LysR family transcriptional regulator n=1 Tax=Gymnodinialimonas mytili TaxID=3126503 RepID=UPI00309FC718